LKVERNRNGFHAGQSGEKFSAAQIRVYKKA
jgi:hypothetical protein